MKKRKKMKKDNRGGARPGAGRPTTEQPKRTISFCIDNDLLDYVNSTDNKSELINRALRTFKEIYHI